MSFTNQTKKNTYSGDGVTAAFAFSFPILAETDLLVQIKDTNGTVTSKTITTHYTVSGTGNRTGFTDYTSGTVTFTAGNIPASTDTVIIKRNVPGTQETDYTEKGAFPAETHERALDKLTMLHLQQTEDIDRSLKVDSAVSGFDGTLPTPAADKFIKIDSAGTGLELSDDTSVIGALSKADGTFYVGDGTTVVAESGATARASLGLTIGTDVQAYDAGLADIAGLATTNNAFIVGDGANWTIETGDTARASLSLSTADTPTFNALDLNDNITLEDTKGVQDTSGNKVWTISKTASAVNYLLFTNAATSNAPSLTATGDDTNIDLILDGKGTGAVKTTSSNLDITGNIVVSGTVDGRDIATDGTKLDGIEASADVTDETNVKGALDGATISSATVATGDKVLIQDVDDSDNLKTVTAQSIADLASGGTGPAVLAYLGSNQTLSSGTFTKMQFDTESFDTDNDFDSTTNYRHTPTTAGYYLVTVQGYRSTGTSSQYVAAIYKNGTEIARNSTEGDTVSPSVTYLVSMNGTTDYLEGYFFHGPGGDILGGSKFSFYHAVYVRGL